MTPTLLYKENITSYFLHLDLKCDLDIKFDPKIFATAGYSWYDFIKGSIIVAKIFEQ